MKPSPRGICAALVAVLAALLCSACQSVPAYLSTSSGSSSASSAASAPIIASTTVSPPTATTSTTPLPTLPPTPSTTTAPARLPDCPNDLHCTLDPPAYTDAAKNSDGTFSGDGTYNYTLLDANGQQRPIYGITVHTTEGTTEQAVEMSHTAPAQSSWNYLLLPTGDVEQSVPINGVAYDSANRFFNTGYLQIEIIGHAGTCDVTAEQYRSLATLARYLSQRFSFPLNTATVIGHDSVPGVSDGVQSIQHWDPGVCFDWQQLFASLGVPAVQPGDVSTAKVVTVVPPFKGNVQPLTACTDTSQCDPAKALQTGLNFVTVYSAPSEQAPPFADPYIHSDNSPGSTAMNDWGAKAPYGHSYVVAANAGDWTAIWFSGKIGWLRSKYLVAASGPTAKYATPNGTGAIAYGRPMPSHEEFDASALPDPIWNKLAVPADLTQYSLTAGQAYTVVPVTVVNDFYAGCDTVTCTAPGDGTIVHGKEQYVMIDLGSRYAFVKNDSVSLSAS